MLNQPNRILALDPGTRHLGVAVLENGELIFYGIKSVQGQETRQEVLREAVRILKKLIEGYRPDILAIEQTFVLQASATFLRVVVKKLKAAARRSGLDVYEYAPIAVRSFFCHPEKPTKQLTAQKIAERYPYFKRHLECLNEWERLYYAHLFDAVALGLYCDHQLNKTQPGELDPLEEALKSLLSNEASNAHTTNQSQTDQPGQTLPRPDTGAISRGRVLPDKLH